MSSVISDNVLPGISYGIHCSGNMCCIDDNTSPSGRHDAAGTVAGQYNDSVYDDTPVSESPRDGSLLHVRREVLSEKIIIIRQDG